MSERLGIAPSKVGEVVQQLRSTTPFNLLYICDYKRSKFIRRYRMAVFDVNLTGKPMDDEIRPVVSSHTVRYRTAVKIKPRRATPVETSQPAQPSAALQDHSQSE